MARSPWSGSQMSSYPEGMRDFYHVMGNQLSPSRHPYDLYENGKSSKRMRGLPCRQHTSAFTLFSAQNIVARSSTPSGEAGFTLISVAP
jgi:hypothetical protein